MVVLYCRVGALGVYAGLLHVAHAVPPFEIPAGDLGPTDRRNLYLPFFFGPVWVGATSVWANSSQFLTGLPAGGGVELRK